MTPDILAKLTAELKAGITTEPQVVYLLAGIRKIIERDELGDELAALKFHCDWALHARLDRSGARAVLQRLEEAFVLLRAKIELHDLPRDVRTEVDRISKMNSFKEELFEFLERHELPPLTLHYPDGWARFLHLYTKVIEDIPLVLTLKSAERNAPPGAGPNVSRITVHCETARAKMEYCGREDVLFRVIWRIEDRIGQAGELSVFNSFEAKSPHRDNAR